MNTILSWVAKFAFGNKMVGALAWIHDKLDGKRTEISASLLGIVHALKLAGIIPAEQAVAIEAALLAILPIVIADKASKIIKQIDAVAPDLPKA